jgi:hypothetical protein
MTGALSLESGWAGCAEVVETLEEEDDTERFDRPGAASCCVLGKPEGEAGDPLTDAPLVPLAFAALRVRARSPWVARWVRKDEGAVRGIGRMQEFLPVTYRKMAGPAVIPHRVMNG